MKTSLEVVLNIDYFMTYLYFIIVLYQYPCHVSNQNLKIGTRKQFLKHKLVLLYKMISGLLDKTRILATIR